MHEALRLILAQQAGWGRKGGMGRGQETTGRASVVINRALNCVGRGVVAITGTF